MKKDKIIFWIATGLLSLQMLFSAGMYIFNHEFAKAGFIALGYPTYIIYPLVIAKILGVIAILSRKSKELTQFAYAGFLYVGILGMISHLAVRDGAWLPVTIFTVLVIISYIYEKKLK